MVVLIALLVLAQDPPKPSFDGIEYSKPEKYLNLPETHGKADRIKKVAGPLKGKTDEETIRNIGRWVDANLKYDPREAYKWRDVEKVMDDGEYGGCADHALVFGALARACEIPTVWVKTMDADWIHEFRADPDGFDGTWSGHVFLEVYVNKGWRLLDAAQLTIYDAYDPKTRILPGARYAYDKGGDPFELVLSVRWEEWKKQTRNYFRDFDLKLLPVSGGRDLKKVYISGNSPVWEMVQMRCNRLGIRSHAFNGQFDRKLREARGLRLVLTSVGEDLALPEKFHATHSPLSPREIRAALEKAASGTASRTLDDGTRVLLIYGRTSEDIRRVVEDLKID